MKETPLTIEDLEDEIGSPDQDFRETFKPTELLVGGVKLAPFSAFRRAVAQAMGMRWGSLTQADISEIKDEGKTVSISYPGLPKDVTLVAYICAISEDAVLLADENPRKAKLEAFKWAEKHGIIFPSPAFQRAQAIVSEIFSAEASATATPAEGGGDGSKKNS